MYSKMYALLAMSAFFFGNLVVTNHAEEVLSFQVIQPAGNIYVGDQVQLQCVISGFVGDTDAVLIFQRIGDTDVQTLASDEGRYFNAPLNVQSSGIQDNSIVSVTINDIDVSFSGDFTCYIAKIAGLILDQQHLKLDVLLPPPSCSVAPLNDDLIFNVMDEIRLTCISDNPQSMLLWNLQSQIAITLPLPDTTSSSDIVTSTVDLILSTNYDGTTFTCLRDSDRETCMIGPLQVRRSLLPTTDTLLVTFTESSKHTDNSTMSTGGLQSGVIVAIVLSIIVIIAIVSVAIVVDIRSRHLCDKIQSNPASADNSHDNPHMSIDNHDGHSPAEGENYTSLQKNTLEDKSAKLYQDLQPVPRSPNNHETDGDQCINVRMDSLEAEEPDYVVKSVSHKTMNASKNDSGHYEDVEELPGETYEEIPEKCYEEIQESHSGISPIPAAQEPKSVVQHVFLDSSGEADANEGAPEAAVNTPDMHDQSSPVHVNSSNEVVYANQTRVQDFK